MSNSNQIQFTSPWNNSNTQEQIQSTFPPRRSSSDAESSPVPPFSDHPSQRPPRIGPIRTGLGLGDLQLESRSSLSSLSGAMGTSYHQPPYNLARSTGSSPSSEASSHSHQNLELQAPWADLGLPGASGHTQGYLSPPNAQQTLMSFENINLGQSLNSRYLQTPPTASTDLPQTPYSMHPPQLSHQSGRYSIPQRSASASFGAGPSSPHVLLPLSAPANRMVGFPTSVSGLSAPHSPSPPGMYNPSPIDGSDEYGKVMHDLQMENQQLQARVAQLQNDLSSARAFAQPGPSGYPSLPNITLPSHQSVSPEMEEAWRRRTDARIRKFCSANRAGNALCAWHDTRRERRKYPARMAPPNTLNCGCTFEQALFEESLARHNVGSYLPGDNVRLDPNLRNPLLKLLQERYGYRDGDFERDPVTGDFIENEGYERWEAELLNQGNRHGGRR